MEGTLTLGNFYGGYGQLFCYFDFVRDDLGLFGVIAIGGCCIPVGHLGLFVGQDDEIGLFCATIGLRVVVVRGHYGI